MLPTTPQPFAKLATRGPQTEAKWGSAGTLFVLTQEGPAVLRHREGPMSRRDAGATETIASPHGSFP